MHHIFTIQGDSCNKMGVRPPQADTGTSEVVEFGIPVLTDRLDDANIQFPATTEEILEGLDAPSIPIDASGHSIHLSEAMQSIDQEEFESKQDLLNQLHPIFEEYRESVSRGLLGSIMDLLPV